MIVGVIGKPNTGKTTFFNATTLSYALVASYYSIEDINLKFFSSALLNSST